MPAKTLTEQALEPGLHWVHPETCLEYEDYHSWFAGDDPIPHWRNARLKEVVRHVQDHGGQGAYVPTGPYRLALPGFRKHQHVLGSLFARAAFEWYSTTFDRRGDSLDPHCPY